MADRNVVPENPMLEINRLTRQFKGRRVLRDISFGLRIEECVTKDSRGTVHLGKGALNFRSIRCFV